MNRRLGLAFALALALSACGNFSDRAAAGKTNEYVWLTRYDVKTIDPAAVQDWTTGTVLSYLYPSIGELCTIETKDNLVFHLRVKPAQFTNGEPVTSEDIRQTIERCLWTENLSTVGNQFAREIKGSSEYPNPNHDRHLGGLDVQPSQDIDIYLDRPDTAFKEKLKNRAFGVTNHHMVRRDHPIEDYKLGYGAGNWTLEKISPGTEWTLKRRKTGETLKFRFSGDSANRRNLYDTKAGDYAMFAAHEIGVVKGHKDLTKGGPTTLVYLQINPKTKPALAKALRFTMKAVIQTYVHFNKILGDHVTKATSFTGAELDPLPSSGLPSEVKFNDSQLQNEHFEITFAEIGMQNPSVEALVSELRKLGMNIQGRAMPSGAMLEANAKGEIPMLFTGWQPDFGGPLNTIPMLFHSKSSENHSGYSNPDVDALIDKAQQGIDTESNINLAQSQIWLDAPCIPLYVQRDLVLMRREPPKP